MTIINRYYKNSKCNVFSFIIYLVLVEHVDKWITSKTAREKTELQKQKVNRKREPLHSKTKTQQCFTDFKTKAQVRERKGRRSELEHEEHPLLNVDNVWIKCG